MGDEARGPGDRRGLVFAATAAGCGPPSLRGAERIEGLVGLSLGLHFLHPDVVDLHRLEVESLGAVPTAHGQVDRRGVAASRWVEFY